MAEQKVNCAMHLNRYLVRPLRRQGEGLSAWISRHFMSNAMLVPKQIQSMITLSYRNQLAPAMRRQKLEEINALLNQDAQFDSYSWLAWCFEWSSAQKTDWQCTHRRYDPHAFCPHCLEEWGYFLELWEIPGIEACPRHGIKLATTCPTCGIALAEWKMVKGIYVCQCETPLTEFNARPATTQETEWARNIALSSGISLPDHYFFACERVATSLSPLCMYFLNDAFTKSGWDKRRNRHEMQVIFRWPEYHRKLLRRLVGQMFIGSGEPIQLIAAEQNLTAMLCVLIAKVRSRKNQEIEGVVRKELGRNCLFICGKFILYANPACFPEGVIGIRLRFVGWWSSIKWRRSDDHHERTHLKKNNLSRFHQPLVCQIVTTLIKFVMQEMPSCNCHELWSVWLPSMELRSANDHEKIIEQLIRELYQLPIHELRRISDLLGLCEEAIA